MHFTWSILEYFLSNVKVEISRTLKRKYKLNVENIARVKETVKQRTQLKAQRMGRYEKRGKFYR